MAKELIKSLLERAVIFRKVSLLTRAEAASVEVPVSIVLW